MITFLFGSHVSVMDLIVVTFWLFISTLVFGPLIWWIRARLHRKAAEKREADAKEREVEAQRRADAERRAEAERRAYAARRAKMTEAERNQEDEDRTAMLLVLIERQRVEQENWLAAQAKYDKIHESLRPAPQAPIDWPTYKPGSYDVTPRREEPMYKAPEYVPYQPMKLPDPPPPNPYYKQV